MNLLKECGNMEEEKSEELVKMQREELRKQLALAHEQINKIDNGSDKLGDVIANVHMRAQELTGINDLTNVSDEDCDKMIEAMEKGELGKGE